MFLKRPLKPMTLVFQREFALRLTADPGSANYGRLTVAVRHRANTQLMEFVPRTAFRPIPKVDSCIVGITPKLFVTPVDENFLDQLIRYLFSQRRRTIKGALRHATRTAARKPLHSLVEPADLLEKRIFQLTPSEFESISNNLSPQRKLFKFSNR
jgi:16S rRNA (adenine1518-N6/adenine1519-N6)-dimethyltransferase